MKNVSVVIPVWNEEESVSELAKEIADVAKTNGLGYEIVFVDDGSTDKTLETLEGIASDNGNVLVVPLKRHSGKVVALKIGLEAAKNDYIVTMDGDLQDDPKEIPNLITALDSGYDMVVGWKKVRKDPITKRLPSKFFNWLTGKITGVSVHDCNCGLKIMKREVVKDLDLYGELHRYIPAMAHMKGYKVGEIPVNHRPRLHGKSKFGAARLFKGMFDLLTVKFLYAYSSRPMHLFGSLGTLSLSSGFLISAYMTYLWWQNIEIWNRPLLLLGILLLVLGVQMFSLGLLGELIVNTRSKSK
jgi:glycosyltransferase involved in cell wall biosynthesis